MTAPAITSATPASAGTHLPCSEPLHATRPEESILRCIGSPASESKGVSYSEPFYNMRPPSLELLSAELWEMAEDAEAAAMPASVDQKLETDDGKSTSRFWFRPRKKNGETAFSFPRSRSTSYYDPLTIKRNEDLGEAGEPRKSMRSNTLVPSMKLLEIPGDEDDTAYEDVVWETPDKDVSDGAQRLVNKGNISKSAENESVFSVRMFPERQWSSNLPPSPSFMKLRGFGRKRTGAEASISFRISPLSSGSAISGTPKDVSSSELRGQTEGADPAAAPYNRRGRRKWKSFDDLSGWVDGSENRGFADKVEPDLQASMQACVPASELTVMEEEEGEITPSTPVTLQARRGVCTPRSRQRSGSVDITSPISPKVTYFSFEKHRQVVMEQAAKMEQQSKDC